ncbi:MAG: hypothetical protein ACI4T3_04305 [Lactobacillus sp.]
MKKNELLNGLKDVKTSINNGEITQMAIVVCDENENVSTAIFARPMAALAITEMLKQDVLEEIKNKQRSQLLKEFFDQFDK